MRLLAPEGVSGVDKVRIPRVSYEEALAQMQHPPSVVATPSSSDPNVRFDSFPFPLSNPSGARRNMMHDIKSHELRLTRSNHRQLLQSQNTEPDHHLTIAASSTSPLSRSSQLDPPRMSAFASETPSNMYGGRDQAALAIPDPWSPPPPSTIPPQSVRSTSLQAPISPTAGRLPSSRPTATAMRGTVSYSGKALQPPVDYQGFIGNEGIATEVTPHGQRKIMRIASATLHGKIAEALGGAIQAIDVRNCADPFTAGETYLGSSPSLVGQLELAVGRFFVDQSFSTGVITEVSGSADSLVRQHRRVCVIAKTSQVGVTCAALGMRCLFAIEDAMVTILRPDSDANSTYLAYVFDFAECLPLGVVFSCIEAQLSAPVAAAAIVHVMKLVLRTLQKLAGRRVVHGHLDDERQWVVGIVTNGIDADVVVLPIGWDDAVDFRVFANSEVGATIALERPATSSRDNEEAEMAMLHVGYDMSRAIPALVKYFDLPRFLDPRSIVDIQELGEWAGRGGHSSTEYTFKVSEVVGRLAPIVGDPKASIPWHFLLPPA